MLYALIGNLAGIARSYSSSGEDETLTLDYTVSMDEKERLWVRGSLYFSVKRLCLGGNLSSKYRRSNVTLPYVGLFRV